MRKKAYARAGVDIDLGNQVKSELPEMLASTHRKEVLGKVGGFGGLFALDVKRYKQPVLVSSVDGVGTKLKIAFATGKHDTIGMDLVNHCVNDIAVLGAEPLFFLDYLGAGQLKPNIFKEIIAGFAQGCALNGCSLIGGETAQMPGFYQPGEYDVSGTIVGVVEKGCMLDGTKISAGDVILGLPSSGLHTNGYSLARKVLLETMGLPLKKKVPELEETLGNELMKVHVSYWPLLKKLWKKFPLGKAKSAVRGLAHITGGGFVDNIPRVLPNQCDAEIHLGSWPVPPVFGLIGVNGKVPDEEMYQVFNMGIGMVIVVSGDQASSVVSWIKRQGLGEVYTIGAIIPGTGRVRLKTPH